MVFFLIACNKGTDCADMPNKVRMGFGCIHHHREIRAGLSAQLKDTQSHPEQCGISKGSTSGCCGDSTGGERPETRFYNRQTEHLLIQIKQSLLCVYSLK